jgi:hypothetical protein
VWPSSGSPAVEETESEMKMPERYPEDAEHAFILLLAFLAFLALVLV